MDKKKVEELIEKTIRFTKVTDDDYIQGNVKSHIINTLQVALKELSRSHWKPIKKLEDRVWTEIKQKNFTLSCKLLQKER